MAQVEFNVPGPGTYLIDADPSLPPLSQPGTAADVLTGEQFYDEEGNSITGTMPNNPAEAVVIPGGGSYTIPQGYHTGQGTVTSEGAELPTLTNPAATGEIVSGKQAIDQDGEVLTGTMTSNPAISETLEAGESYQVPAGYTPGGTVQAASLASQTPGTATQDDIIQGQTAWVNGVQITGALESGSDTSDATATAADILEGETAYVATGKVEGTMPTRTADDVTIQNTTISVASGYYGPNTTKTIPTVEQATPSISVSAGGLITTTAEQTAGFVADGSKSATQQLPAQGAQTITPGTTAQTIQANVYLTGAQTIQGDANLVPDNIKENVSIFGVTGTYAGEQASFAVPLTVNVSTGATVTAVNGDTTLMATSVDGQANFVLTSGGTWTLNATLDGKIANGVVEIPNPYIVTLSFPTVSYDGVATQLSVGRGELGKANVGDYILFAGGQTRTDSSYAYYSGAVDSYDSSLSKTTPSSLSQARADVMGATAGSYAVFSGGAAPDSSGGPDYSSSVNAYNQSLTRSSPTSLSVGRTGFAATSVGEYALFAGGQISSSSVTDSVNAYNSNLTRTTPNSLSSARYALAGASNGSYALFGGGGFRSYSNIVDAYDAELSRTTPEGLSVARMTISPASTPNYAIFACGYGSSGVSSLVEAYDEFLTYKQGTPLSSPVRYKNDASTSIGNYAFFAEANSLVEMYDQFLTKAGDTTISNNRSNLAAGSVGEYVLFAGGYSGTGLTLVDICKLTQEV